MPLILPGEMRLEWRRRCDFVKLKIMRLSKKFLLLAFMPLPVSADVFVYVDAEQVAHYSNQQSDGRFQPLSALMEIVGNVNRAGVLPVKGNAVVYAAQIQQAAEDEGVNPALVHAVINAESGYNPSAVSRVGAQGLMQLMPGTARRYAVKDAFDPEQNIRGGTRYLRDLLEMFDNDLELTVAAYNAGENAVLKYGRKIPPYRETKAYVPKVLRYYNKYAALVQ